MIVSSRKPVPKAPELISIPLGRKTKNTRLWKYLQKPYNKNSQFQLSKKIKAANWSVSNDLQDPSPGAYLPPGIITNDIKITKWIHGVREGICKRKFMSARGKEMLQPC
jgi:hypothetical protein